MLATVPELCMFAKCLGSSPLVGVVAVVVLRVLYAAGVLLRFACGACVAHPRYPGWCSRRLGHLEPGD